MSISKQEQNKLNDKNFMKGRITGRITSVGIVLSALGATAAFVTMPIWGLWTIGAIGCSIAFYSTAEIITERAEKITTPPVKINSKTSSNYIPFLLFVGLGTIFRECLPASAANSAISSPNTLAPWKPLIAAQ